MKKEGSKVTINTHYPGLIATNIGNDTSDDKANKSLTLHVMNYFKKSLDKGIETAYYLALSNQVSQISGRYFDSQKLKYVSYKGYTDTKAQKLIDFCKKVSGN